MHLVDYLPILIQLILAILIAITILVASHIFGQKGKANKIKDMAYECGLPALTDTQKSYSIKFYVTTMLFILLDIEMMFLIPWALVYTEFLEANLPILTPMLFFIFVLLLGLLYEWKKGALEWEK